MKTPAKAWKWTVVVFLITPSVWLGAVLLASSQARSTNPWAGIAFILNYAIPIVSMLIMVVSGFVIGFRLRTASVKFPGLALLASIGIGILLAVLTPLWCAGWFIGYLALAERFHWGGLAGFRFF